jgi:hypothetical protein
MKAQVLNSKLMHLAERMRAFLSIAKQDDKLIEMLDEAFRLSMVDNYPQASVLWLEGDNIEMDSFLSDDAAIEEASSHNVAFFVPAGWHAKKECTWIWEEEDVESGTMWCCRDYDGIAKLSRMEDMWEYVLDYHNPYWLQEADSVIEYVGKENK